jgi:putative flippase GtrA
VRGLGKNVGDLLRGSRFLRFLAGGVVTFVTTLALMAVWYQLVGLPRLPAYALTHATAFVVGFVLNRRWVFQATEANPASQGVRFAAAQLGFRGVDWCVFSAIEALVAPPVIVGILAANVLVLPCKYLFYRAYVFPRAGLASASTSAPTTGMSEAV